MHVKNYFNLNSRTVIARVYNDSFVGELIEIEKLAEDLGIYGHILKYRIENNGPLSNVIFTLDA